MMDFITGQSANGANDAIKSSLKTRDAAHQCAVLWFEEILTRKLYLELGYSSINQYAKLELGFSKSHAGEFLALCRTFKRLPKVKEKVAEGKLTYTSARVLGTIVDESNQDEWLDIAETKSRRELEKEVKRARREAVDITKGQASLIPLPGKNRPTAVVPVRVHMEMSPTQFARYEKLWEKVRKQRNASPDRVEALLGIMESFVSRNLLPSPKRSARADLSPIPKPPVQIHIHQCPDCEKATIQTSKGELEIASSELEQAQCDCQTSEPNKRNTTSIPPAARRMVMAKARNKCQRQGCDHTLFLEVHHKIPRSQGGTNGCENLQVLCSACHRLFHEKSNAGMGFMAKESVAAYLSSPALLPDPFFPLFKHTSNPKVKNNIAIFTSCYIKA